MKQLIFLGIIVIVGFFIFQGGVGRVLSKANIDTKGIISDITQSIDENYIPDIVPERLGFHVTNGSSFEHVKNTIFMTYDPEICFAFIDMAYTSSAGHTHYRYSYIVYNQMGVAVAEALNKTKSVRDALTYYAGVAARKIAEG